jgi:(p)ppGpp synthase/HD superfamily hydrolase
MIRHCLRIAEEAHRAQKDNQGYAYIGHVIRVACEAGRKAQANGMTADAVDKITMAGFLHDVIEDTPITAKWLIERGVPAEVVAMVQTLTRTKDSNLTYQQWIDHICETGSIGAIIVKWADNTDNLNPDRRSGLPEGMDKRYLRARERLEHCLAVKGYAAL